MDSCTRESLLADVMDLVGELQALDPSLNITKDDLLPAQLVTDKQKMLMRLGKDPGPITSGLLSAANLLCHTVVAHNSAGLPPVFKTAIADASSQLSGDDEQGGEGSDDEGIAAPGA